MSKLDLLIAGDLVPTQSNRAMFDSGDVEGLIGEHLRNLLRESDFRIFNLEVPLCDREEPIPKCGPNLIAPTSAVKGIKALDPSLLTLANNHILDQGFQGLQSTVNLLRQKGIFFVGVGNNLTEASKPHIFERDGIRIGIYACAEHEFSIATPTSAGANPFDPLESLDHLVALKAQCDYVIVLYHGGKEHYRYPSPYLQKVCRKITQKGADLVVCQHSHCVGCYEEFEGSTIVYGQGNFLFDHSDSEFWQTSILIQVNIVDGGLRLDYVPIVKAGNGVRLAKGQKAEEILQHFYERSNEILDDGFVEQQYRQFARTNREAYLRRLTGFGKWMSRIDRRLLGGMLLKMKTSEEQLLAIQNYIECEAHRELMLKSIKGWMRRRRRCDQYMYNWSLFW